MVNGLLFHMTQPTSRSGYCGLEAHRNTKPRRISLPNNPHTTLPKTWECGRQSLGKHECGQVHAFGVWLAEITKYFRIAAVVRESSSNYLWSFQNVTRGSELYFDNRTGRPFSCFSMLKLNDTFICKNHPGRALSLQRLRWNNSEISIKKETKSVRYFQM